MWLESFYRSFALGILASSCVSSSAVAARATPSALPFLSVDANDVVSYVSRFHTVPTEEEMRREIPTLPASFNPSVELKNEVLRETGMTAEVLRYFNLEKNPELVNMNLDGLQMRQICSKEIVLLHALTSPVEAHPDRTYYPRVVERATVTKTLSIARTCWAPECRRSGLRGMFDLATYNQTPVCQTALCVAERMFGRERAVLMTWT